MFSFELCMQGTVSKENAKNEKERQTLEDVLVKSRSVHDGFAVDRLETEINQVIKEKKWFEDDSWNKCEEDRGLTNKDIKSWLTGWLEESESNTLKNLPKKDSVYVEKNDSNAVAECTGEYQLSISFLGPLDEEQEFFAYFDNLEMVESVSKTLRESAPEERLRFIHKNDGYYLADKGNLRAFLVDGVTHESVSIVREWSLLLSLITTLIASPYIGAVSILLLIGLVLLSLLLTFGYEVLLSAKMSIKEGEYCFEQRIRSEPNEITVLEGIGADMTGEISMVLNVHMNEYNVKLESNDLTTEWRFDIKDGLMEKSGVEFFENIGFDTEHGEEIRLNAEPTGTADKERDGIESTDGSWYLYSERLGN